MARRTHADDDPQTELERELRHWEAILESEGLGVIAVDKPSKR